MADGRFHGRCEEQDEGKTIRGPRNFTLAIVAETSRCLEFDNTCLKNIFQCIYCIFFFDIDIQVHSLEPGLLRWTVCFSADLVCFRIAEQFRQVEVVGILGCSGRPLFSRTGG